MNNKKFKNIPSGIKYLVLIVVVIILVIVFKVVTNSMYSEQPNPNEDINNNPSTSTDNNPATSTDNNPIDPTDPDGTIIGNKDNIDITQYTLFDTYILTSNHTQYGNYGWKYFLIRSYSEFTNYVENYFTAIDNTDISAEISNLKENITSDFFKTGCVIIIVDYSLNDISGLVDNIMLSDTLATISINRNITNTNFSKYVTHVLPIKSNTIRTVQIQYTK
ncbi:MAG: hypothetical protein PHH22_02175 [Clostridia bacterium]|nr:hypothetical protein [Clostridia bacterium]